MYLEQFQLPLECLGCGTQGSFKDLSMICQPSAYNASAILIHNQNKSSPLAYNNIE